jgi:predicted RNA binding protein YcfA (HicA-like mRNA interferase family)
VCQAPRQHRDHFAIPGSPKENLHNPPPQRESTAKNPQRLGFVVARQSGRHIVIRRTGQGCFVPNHREVKVRTVNGVLRQAGVTAKEFKSALLSLVLATQSEITLAHLIFQSDPSENGAKNQFVA